MDRRASVAFCDLDGTLVLDNSFHIFLASIWSETQGLGRASFALHLLPRLLGPLGGGHAGLKRRVLLWFATQAPDWQSRVVACTLGRLRRTMSVPVLTRLQRLKAEGTHIVLATAAPSIYANALARDIGADDCLATQGTVGPDWAELLGRRKAEACRDWLDKHQARVNGGQIVVLTDHADDLPLLALADRAVLQASPRRLAEITRRLESVMAGRPMPEVETIDLCAPQEGGGFWLWFDDRPEGPVDEWDVKMILSKHRYACVYAGEGTWRQIGPGASLQPAVRRRECPRPPGARQRLTIHLGRRVLRDGLGIFH